MPSSIFSTFFPFCDWVRYWPVFQSWTLSLWCPISFYPIELVLNVWYCICKLLITFDRFLIFDKFVHLLILLPPFLLCFLEYVKKSYFKSLLDNSKVRSICVSVLMSIFLLFSFFATCSTISPLNHFVLLF